MLRIHLRVSISVTWRLFYEKPYRKRTDIAITFTLNQPDVYRLALVLSRSPICVALHSGNSLQSDHTYISNQPQSYNKNLRERKYLTCQEVGCSVRLRLYGHMTQITPSHSNDLWGVISKRQTWQHYCPLLLAKDARKYLTLQRSSLAASANSHFQGQMLCREYGR